MINKKILLMIFFVSSIAITMGCIGGGGDFEETKLDVEEGVGLIDTLRIEELRPGLSGYVSLTVRSNFEGAGSSDVRISLDNINPFLILECGEEWGKEALDEKRPENCFGQLDQDEFLPIRTRGTSRIFPGEEIEVFWRIRAPSKDEISDIALRHPLYYNVEYIYSVNFRQNIIFMSQEEMIRRRERGEDYVMTGETRSTAGEIRFSGATRQPIYYSFDYPAGGPPETRSFDFVLSYSVENRGKGFPISDIVLIMTYPKEDGVYYNEDILRDYGWHTGLNDLTCHDGNEEGVDCENWLKEDVFEEDEWRRIVAGDNVLFRVVDRRDFIDRFNIHTPLIITSDRMNVLRDRNIPIEIHSFNVYAAYRYYIEGKEYINVYPLRGI